MINRVNANPKMIKWARLDAGYELDDLPKTLKNASKWESGELQPTWNDLRKLANKYKRPPVFYLMSEPPKKEENNIIEFRSDEKIEEYSPELKLEIRKAKYRRAAYINLNFEMGYSIPDFSKNTVTEKNPKKLAEKIRKLLNTSFETQKKWLKNKNNTKRYDHSIFLYQWKEVLYDLGVLVFETEDVEEEEMSGMSLYFDICPIIIINGKNKENRRIFTIMHELCHLILHQSSICDVDKYNKKETLCNKVAAEILVPEKTLSDEKIFFKNGNVNYSGLSHLYGVSQQVIVYKLANMHKISDSTKKLLISQIEERNQKKKEKQKQKNKNSNGGGMSKIAKKKKYEGKPYSRFILNAYENEIISYSKIIRYLNISPNEIDSLYEEVME